MLKENTVVKLEVTGIEEASGKIYDSTNVEEAKKAGIYNENRVYKPAIVILGKQEIVPGLEEEVMKLKEGDNKDIKVTAEKAFGLRKPELIGLVPLKSFKEKKMNPFPGMIFEADGKQGRVQSVSGGRVRVDFNHPLAGKNILFKVKLEKVFENKHDIITALYEKYFGFVEEKQRKVILHKDEADVFFPGNIKPEVNLLKPGFAKTLQEIMPELKEIRFIEVYRREEKKETETL
ncbi:MAG: peptidylprolyl isomerase [archaeon]